MHSFRLQCHRINFYRKRTSLLEKCVRLSITNSCKQYSTETSSTGIEHEQFKAAVLHPKKQNLTVETLVLPETAADGMV